MDFEEDLAVTIREALTAKAKEEADAKAFRDGWESHRKTVVYPILQRAASVMAPLLSGTHADFHNGSAVLQSPLMQGVRQFTLKFAPKKDALEVECSSNLAGDEPESFTLDGLDAATVERKVKEFAKVIARGKRVEESVYNTHGIRSF